MQHPDAGSRGIPLLTQGQAQGICSHISQNIGESGSMDKKVVLITGCYSGIGLSLAVRLASDPDKTFKVYATMRNLAKKERLLECVKGLHKDTLEILQMDVTDRQSILDARDRVVEKRLDILGLPFNEVYCASNVILIECGPVNTDFLVNLQKAELGDTSLQQLDTRTLSLYEK
ncbi:hypothetical protein INR49_011082 [Caranx melampygus]|nr:hypothetical protein INR49_011082 [Caranx melampygus]